MEALSFELHGMICESLLESTAASLQSLSHVEEPKEIDHVADKVEQSIDVLQSLSLANKYWQTVAKPILDKLPATFLEQGVKQAPWQIAESRKFTKTKYGRVVVNLDANDYYLNPYGDRNGNEEKEEMALPSFVNSILKLPEKYRAGIVRLTTPKKPYKFMHNSFERGTQWIWYKRPIANELLWSHVNKYPTDQPQAPWFLQTVNYAMPWIEGIGHRHGADVLRGLINNQLWSLLCLLKAVNVQQLTITYDPEASAYVISKNEAPRPPSPLPPPPPRIARTMQTARKSTGGRAPRKWPRRK